MADPEYSGTFLHYPFKVAEVLYRSGLPAGMAKLIHPLKLSGPIHPNETPLNLPL